MQTKRSIFSNRWLPYALLAPQLAITAVFFLWPASQAVKSSFEREDPFGFRTTFIWFDNYTRILADPGYLNALGRTAIFACGVTFLSMSVALLLAVCVDRVLRMARLY